jgi:hypothetical protein
MKKVITAVFVLCLFGAVIFFALKYMSTSGVSSSTASSSSSGLIATSEHRIPPPGQLEYRNQRYHFSLFYSQELGVKEYGGDGNSLTVTFGDNDPEHAFQIFVVPYNQQQITPERFKEDDLSGVMTEPTDVVVGGARATMFFSTNAVMGDTREVWFIKDGLLYEVTTYKALDTWLADILKSWQFVP